MSGAKQTNNNSVDGEIVEKHATDAPKPKQMIKASVQRSWSGSLPPPEVFKQYPTEVQRAIMKHADRQMKHRHAIEDKVVASGFGLVALGHSTAGLVAIFGTGGVQDGN